MQHVIFAAGLVLTAVVAAGGMIWSRRGSNNNEALKPQPMTPEDHARRRVMLRAIIRRLGR